MSGAVGWRNGARSVEDCVAGLQAIVVAGCLDQAVAEGGFLHSADWSEPCRRIDCVKIRGMRGINPTARELSGATCAVENASGMQKTQMTAREVKSRFLAPPACGGKARDDKTQNHHSEMSKSTERSGA